MNWFRLRWLKSILSCLTKEHIFAVEITTAVIEREMGNKALTGEEDKFWPLQMDRAGAV